MSTVDFAEVSRTAHQLALDHGHSAHLYAAKLSREAGAAGRQDDAEFWGALARAMLAREGVYDCRESVSFVTARRSISSLARWRTEETTENGIH